MFGFRRSEVNEAIEVLESELGRRAEALRGRETEVGRLTQEVSGLRVELDAARARADGELHSITVLAQQLEEIQIGARGAATRIRLCALREAAEVNARLIDIDDPRMSLVRDQILDALEDAIDRVAGEWEGGGVEAPTPPLSRSAEGRIAFASGQVVGASRRHVSVDVGPFEDFSQLVQFEDAANAIGATGDISIRRFSGGRARIDVALSEPVDLLRELEENCDLDFRLRSRDDDELILDVA